MPNKCPINVCFIFLCLLFKSFLISNVKGIKNKHLETTTFSGHISQNVQNYFLDTWLSPLLLLPKVMILLQVDRSRTLIWHGVRLIKIMSQKLNQVLFFSWDLLESFLTFMWEPKLVFHKAPWFNFHGSVSKTGHA